MHSSLRRISAAALSSILLLCLVAPALADVTIRTRDGRVFTLPVDCADIESFSCDQAQVPLPPEDPMEEPLPDMSGLWTTSEGELLLSQSEADLNGSFDGGDLHGTLSRDPAREDALVFNGIWVRELSGKFCPQEQGGSHYWGRVELFFTGSMFSGKWGYCDSVSYGDWTGRRQ